MLCLLATAALAGPMSANQDGTLKIVSDGETVLEAAPLPQADLQRLKAWLAAPDASKITVQGSSLTCGPVTLTVNAAVVRYDSQHRRPPAAV